MLKNEFFTSRGVVMSCRKWLHTFDGKQLSYTDFALDIVQNENLDKELAQEYFSNRSSFVSKIKLESLNYLPSREAEQIKALRLGKGYLQENRVTPCFDSRTGKICFMLFDQEKLIPFCVKNYAKLVGKRTDSIVAELLELELKHEPELHNGFHDTFFNWTSYEHLVFENYIN